MVTLDQIKKVQKYHEYESFLLECMLTNWKKSDFEFLLKTGHDTTWLFILSALLAMADD